MRICTIALFAISMAATASAAPIAGSSPGGTGVDGDVSFTWQGLEFTLSDQPSGNPTAAHRVVGDSEGELDILLEGPGLVDYIAEVPLFARPQTRWTLDYRYGADLSASTAAFSFLNAQFRRLEGGVDAVTQLLAGSDAENPASVFYGAQSRGTTQGTSGFPDNAFLDNLGFGVDGSLLLVTNETGEISTSVTAATTMLSAGFTLDQTPDGALSPFGYTEVILQVGSFMEAGAFGDQFGADGQRFTFGALDVTPVPLPAGLPLLLAALGLAGVVARGARPTAA